MTAIRRAGYYISGGQELDRGSIGIAAPIILGTPHASGSIGTVFGEKRFATSDENLLVWRITIDAAKQVERPDSPTARTPPAYDAVR